MKTTNISEYIVNELLTMFFPAIREFVKWVFLLLLSRLQPAFDRDRSLARRLLRRHSINQRITNSSPVKENINWYRRYYHEVGIPTWGKSQPRPLNTTWESWTERIKWWYTSLADYRFPSKRRDKHHTTLF